MRKVLVSIVILAAVVVLAAMKNPSEQQSKEMVRSFLSDKVTGVINKNMADEKSDGVKLVANFLASKLTPGLMDSMVDVETDDYVVMTRFDARVEKAGIDKSVMSGIIIFGKLIPLSSDLTD